MQWNTVTWYSKLGAVILFLFVVPILTFYIGREYERTIEVLERPSVLEPTMLPSVVNPGTTTKMTMPPAPKATTSPQSKPVPVKSNDSGIRGVILRGPTCPVERIPPDPMCADKPYETLVSVFKSTDLVHAVAFAQSGADGTFVINLPPGNYVIGAGESMLPRCPQVELDVLAHSYATTTISCDTGVR